MSSTNIPDVRPEEIDMGYKANDKGIRIEKSGDDDFITLFEHIERIMCVMVTYEDIRFPDECYIQGSGN